MKDEETHGKNWEKNPAKSSRFTGHQPARWLPNKNRAGNQRKGSEKRTTQLLEGAYGDGVGLWHSSKLFFIDVRLPDITGQVVPWTLVWISSAQQSSTGLLTMRFPRGLWMVTPMNLQSFRTHPTTISPVCYSSSIWISHRFSYFNHINEIPWKRSFPSSLLSSNITCGIQLNILESSEIFLWRTIILDFRQCDSAELDGFLFPSIGKAVGWLHPMMPGVWPTQLFSQTDKVTNPFLWLNVGH